MPTQKETNDLYAQFGLRRNPLAGGVAKATGRGLKELAKKRKKRKTKVATPPAPPAPTARKGPRQGVGRRLINHLFPSAD